MADYYFDLDKFDRHLRLVQKRQKLRSRFQAIEWLATKTRFTVKALTNIFTGQGKSPKFAESIADAFGVSLETIAQPAAVINECSRVGPPNAQLIGRERELVVLKKAWNATTTTIVVVQGDMGVGKSELVNTWRSGLSKSSRQLRCLFCWPLQDLESADRFLSEALRSFGDPTPNTGSPRSRGQRLATFILRQRTLLWLDGLEAVQSLSPVPGTLLHEGLLSLFTELATRRNRKKSLCVVTTSLPLPELAADGKRYEKVSVLPMAPLHDDQAIHFLKSFGVWGDAGHFREAVKNTDGNCLFLTLVASYLTSAFGGDVSRHREVSLIDADAQRGGRIAANLKVFENGLNEEEVAILRLISLFSEPVDHATLLELRRRPLIKGLTDSLERTNDAAWGLAVNKLRTLRLLLPPVGPANYSRLDAHGLVREYFSRRLKSTNGRAWREGQGRLYRYLSTLPSTPQLPQKLEDMFPLYRAVAHACEANLHGRALEDVYVARIQQGDRYTSSRKLGKGAVAKELEVLRGFFVRGWDDPIPSLDKRQRAYVLSEAGCDLRYVGRTVDAREILALALQQYQGLGNVRSPTVASKVACRDGAMIGDEYSELLLECGESQLAIKVARDSLRLAEKAGTDHAYQAVGKLTTVAWALFHFGQDEDDSEMNALFAKFDEQDRALAGCEPELYSSLFSHRYCEYLLRLGKIDEILSRVKRTLAWSMRQGYKADIGVDQLTLGLAYTVLDKLDEAEAVLKKAAESLDTADKQHLLVRAHLALGTLFLKKRDHVMAERYVREVIDIAEYRGLRLYIADAHLRLAHAKWESGQKSDARKSLEIARGLILACAYRLREQELEETAAIFKQS